MAREAPTTAVENSDHPLLSAVTGFSCKSEKLGAAADDRPKDGCWDSDGGVGVFPNPWYRPPWEGGRWSGLDALACPKVEKKASLAVFWSVPEWFKLGVEIGVLVPEFEKDAGEAEFFRSSRPVLLRVEARDLRSP